MGGLIQQKLFNRKFSSRKIYNAKKFPIYGNSFHVAIIQCKFFAVIGTLVTVPVVDRVVFLCRNISVHCMCAVGVVSKFA